MATPRVTIDQLPEQAVVEDTNYIIVQDTGVTKRLNLGTLRNSAAPPLTAHINDTSDAHDATAISAVSSGTGVDGADVQAQLTQLTTLVNGKINQTVADGLYVNLTGDTMTGLLTLSAGPSVDLHAATKKYVDDSVAASSEGITQAEADALYVNVLGDTMTGPLTVEPLITTLTGLVLPAGEPTAANRAAPKSYVDGRVAKAGDTMSGALIIANTGAATQLRLQHATAPTLSLYNADGSVQWGALLGQPTQVRLQAGLGDIHLQSLAGAAILAGNTDVKLYQEDVVGRAIHGWFGLRNPIILPGGDGASDLEGLLTGKGFTIEAGAGLFKVNSIGSTKFSVNSSGSFKAGSNSQIWGTANAYIGLYPAALDHGTVGARGGYMGMNNGDMYMVNETGNATRIQTTGAPIYLVAGSTNPISFYINGVEQGRWVVNAFLCGKSTADNMASSGTELRPNGPVISTATDAGVINYWATHIGATDANAQTFMTFRRTTAGTQIGSISQTNTTGVAFNQTSDKQLKTFTRNVDDDESIDALMTIEPVHYLWNEFPDLGEQIGFFAQDVAPIAPYAVTAGIGKPGDSDYLPWGMDNSKLIPRMVSAMQAMMRRVMKAETELAELKAAM